MQPARDWSPEYANSSHNTISKKQLSPFFSRWVWLKVCQFWQCWLSFKELVLVSLIFSIYFFILCVCVFLLWSFWCLSSFVTVCSSFSSCFHHKVGCLLVIFLVFLRWDSVAVDFPLRSAFLHCTSVGDLRDLSSVPELGRFPGEGNGNPLQYSCLENHIERGVPKVAKIQTQLKRLRTHGFWILTPSLSFVSNIFLFPLWFLQWSISCVAAYFLASMCLCSWQLVFFFFFPL